MIPDSQDRQVEVEEQRQRLREIYQPQTSREAMIIDELARVFQEKEEFERDHQTWMQHEATTALQTIRRLEAEDFLKLQRPKSPGAGRGRSHHHGSIASHGRRRPACQPPHEQPQEAALEDEVRGTSPAGGGPADDGDGISRHGLNSCQTGLTCSEIARSIQANTIAIPCSVCNPCED